MLRQHKELNTLLVILKSIFDSLLTLNLTLDFLPLRMMWISIFWLLGYFLLQFVIKWRLERSQTPDSSWLLASTAVLTYGVSTVLCLLPYFMHPTEFN